MTQFHRAARQATSIRCNRTAKRIIDGAIFADVEATEGEIKFLGIINGGSLRLIIISQSSDQFFSFNSLYYIRFLFSQINTDWK